MTTDYSLWDEASRDHEAEADGRRFVAAKVVTSDWWPYLAGADTKVEFIHRLALIQDRLDSTVAATLPEDADPREVLALSARVCGSLTADWDTAQRTRLVEAAMRKGAPFADYSDFKDCTSKNSDKDDPEAYCGKIQHQTEDSKTSGLASLFVLSASDQAAFEAEIAKLATPFIPHPGPRHLMYQAPNPWGSEVPDSSIPGNSAVEHVKDPAPSPTDSGHDESSFWDKLKTHLVGPQASKTAADQKIYSGNGPCPECGAPADKVKLTASPETNPLAGSNRYKCSNCMGEFRSGGGKSSSKTAADVPPQFLEQQKKDDDSDGDSNTKDDKGSDDSGPGSAKWKEQQDGTNGDSKADPDDDGKAEDGSSNSAQKDDDSDGDDKKSDGPPPWVKNKQSAKTADLVDPGQAERVVNWLAHGGPPPQGEDLDAIKRMYEQERGRQSSLRAEADNEAPYRIQGDGPYKVVNSNGDVKGTHDTRDEALAQQRALYANVPGAREKAEADEKRKSSAIGDPVRVTEVTPCNTCGMTGKIDGRTCPNCGGRGAFEKNKTIGALLAHSASLVTALGEQFTTDNPFGMGGAGGGAGGGMGGGGDMGIPNTAQDTGGGGGLGGMPMTSGPEAQPWQDAASMPQTDMSATPNTPDQTTQDTDSLQRPAVRTASGDKVARITAGVLATNPGMDPATARSIAEETVSSYPGSRKG